MHILQWYGYRVTKINDCFRGNIRLPKFMFRFHVTLIYNQIKNMHAVFALLSKMICFWCNKNNT
jgi:hypothetical protein